MSDLKPIDDPNVKIPAAVRASAAFAQELHQQVYNPPDADAEKQGEAASQDVPRELDASSLLNSEAAPQEQRPAPATETQVTQTGNESSWEHKYNSMKGRYDRAQSQISAMSERISQLETLIATQPPMPEPASRETAPTRLVTPEEETEYGSEFLSVVGKKAREELAPLISQYEEKIASLEARLHGVQGHVVQSSQEKMFSTLDTKLPDWRDVNTNPEFLDWLRLPDPYSGAIRHDMLKAAYERHDAPRVLAFFNGFLAEEAAVAPANSGPDQTPKGKVPLENFAAPSRAKSAAAQNAPAEKPGFTAAQISAFYSDVRAGKFRGREAEKDRIERQIFEAQRLGLIRS